MTTPIQWCDSTCNAEMGCDGCELWNLEKGVRHCYAGIDHERRAGLRGWPASFDQPELFPERIAKAIRWKCLLHTCRPDKPWLDGYPRVIFLNDEGDTFTESLPVDWLSPYVQEMSSKHVWIILTKRPERMLAWVQSLNQPLPSNVWLCVALTQKAATLERLPWVYALRQHLPRHVIGLAIEPLLSDILPVVEQRFVDLYRIVSWAKIGGESNQRQAPARPCQTEWIRGLVDYFRRGMASIFVKQLGSNATENGASLSLKHSHGGDWQEWPADLRIREMPLYAKN